MIFINKHTEERYIFVLSGTTPSFNYILLANARTKDLLSMTLASFERDFKLHIGEELE